MNFEEGTLASSHFVAKPLHLTPPPPPLPSSNRFSTYNRTHVMKKFNFLGLPVMFTVFILLVC